MPYLTTDDYEARFGTEEAIRLTDRTGAGTVNAEDLAAAITDAEATVDAAIAVRYALPLATVPEILVRITADLARERLHDENATPQVTKRADQARKDLELIAKGLMVLPVDGVPVEATQAVDVAAYETGTQLFGEDAETTATSWPLWRQ